MYVSGFKVFSLMLTVIAMLSFPGCESSGGMNQNSAISDPSQQQDEQNVTDSVKQAPTVQDVASKAFGTFTPVVQKGKGDSVVAFPVGAMGAVVSATHSGSSNFTVHVLDSNNNETDLLVNEIGAYSGKTFAGSNGVPSRLKIGADGAWSITIAPVSSSTLMSTAAIGKGDSVLLYDGPAADWTISHVGESNFVVRIIGENSSDLPVNEIGNYNGVIPTAAGPMVIIITADGQWSIKTQ